MFSVSKIKLLSILADGQLKEFMIVHSSVKILYSEGSGAYSSFVS